MTPVTNVKLLDKVISYTYNNSLFGFQSRARFIEQGSLCSYIKGCKPYIILLSQYKQLS